MFRNGFKEGEKSALIPDERVDGSFPSTRAIYRVMHPLLKTECQLLSRRHRRDPSADPSFNIPKPFDSPRVLETMYERWGTNDKKRHQLKYGGETRDGWRVELSTRGVYLMDIAGSTGTVSTIQIDLSPVGKAIVVAGGLDEASFVEFLKTFPFSHEDSLPGLGDFYYRRLIRIASLGMLGSRDPRLKDEDIDRIVECFNWIRSYMESK